MHGIVSLLDETYYRVIEELWAELRGEFGVQGVYVTPYPHFSYHIAQDYQLPDLKAFLHDFAAQFSCFNVRTTGLALFTGERPVLYIPLVRNHCLSKFHCSLWRALQHSGIVSGGSELYHPNQWLPHITIGFGDIDAHKLSQIVPYLSSRDFAWDLHVNNLALIYDTGTEQTLCYQEELKGCMEA